MIREVIARELIIDSPALVVVLGQLLLLIHEQEQQHRNGTQAHILKIQNKNKIKIKINKK
jgi:hypothetical protein